MCLLVDAEVKPCCCFFLECKESYLLFFLRATAGLPLNNECVSAVTTDLSVVMMVEFATYSSGETLPDVCTFCHSV